MASQNLTDTGPCSSNNAWVQAIIWTNADLSSVWSYPRVAGILCSLLLCSPWSIKIIDTLWYAGHILLFANLFIIIMQTYLKALKIQDASQLHSVEYVSKIKSILSIIFMQYTGRCVFSLCISLW